MVKEDSDFVLKHFLFILLKGGNTPSLDSGPAGDCALGSVVNNIVSLQLGTALKFKRDHLAV